MTIEIANKLEVKRGNGALAGFIQVPGCEPLSDLTSASLLANRECGTTLVRLEDALEAIPGSSTTITYNPTILWFILPSGPPPAHGCSGNNTCTDYYEILRNIGQPFEDEVVNDCGKKATDSFDWFRGFKG